MTKEIINNSQDKKAIQKVNYILSLLDNKIDQNTFISYSNFLCNYLKKESIELYKDGSWQPLYYKLLYAFIPIRNQSKHLKINNSSPDFIYDPHFDLSLLFTKDFNEEELVSFIVQATWQKILKNNLIYTGKNINIKDFDMTNLCYDAACYVHKLAKEVDLECHMLTIWPGYDQFAGLYKGYSGYHCFDILSIGNNKYIIDCTYSQFFYLNKNVIDRLGIPLVASQCVGYYMTCDEEANTLASELLTKGYVKYTAQNLKKYLDAFSLSFRNGLYYEILGKVDYTTNYTHKDYINFLAGYDNQLAHEPKEGLGLQKRPLKNIEMNFKINN